MTEIDAEFVRQEHRYEHLTWPEVNEAVAQEKVVVLPIAAIEQQLIADYWNEEVRESGPGGSAHACELETSMYLHIDGDRVRKDRVKGAPASYLTGLEGGAEWQMADLTLGSGPATIVEWTSSTSETGAFGAPELATAEKGRLVFDRSAERLVELVDWFRTRPASERRDHHAKPPSFDLPFGF